MKKFLHKYRSRRRSFDGWAVARKGITNVWPQTICTTREEAREVLDEIRGGGFEEAVRHLEVVPVKINVVRARPIKKESKE